MQPSELKRFRAGDEIIFGTLIASLEASLRVQIRQYAGADRDAADDLFQDVCFKIFQRRLSYAGERPIAAWCYRVCARVCLDEMRRAARAQKRMPTADGPCDCADDSRSEADRASDAEAYQARLDAVTDAVVALAPRRRLIAIYHWDHGWTAARIAQKLHLTAPSVSTSLSRIRAALRLELAPLVGMPSLPPK